jgi:hypothetical protein
VYASVYQDLSVCYAKEFSDADELAIKVLFSPPYVKLILIFMVV